MNKIFCFFMILVYIGINNVIICSNFKNSWDEMQQMYGKLEKVSSAETLSLYCHPYWQESCNLIKKLIQNPPNPRFLFDERIRHTMVRTGFTDAQKYEVCYLKHCISPITKDKIALMQDTDFANLPKECPEFNCSTSTLGHLFYAAKILEFANQPKMIVEFGAGYGNLGRLLKQAVPDLSLILIDLPELCVLQWFYLKNTLPATNVILHTEVPKNFEKNTIHILPIEFLDQVQIQADVFVSTFALSECTQLLQEYMIEKKFFNASLVYITGQLNGWTSIGLNFVSDKFILKGIQNNYNTVICQPFHIFFPNFMSYEIIAKN